MVAVVDIGNSRVAFGFYEGAGLVHRCVFGAQSLRSAEEWMLLTDLSLQKAGYSADMIEGCIIGSVQAPLTAAVRRACELLFHKTPLQVTHGLRTGLAIRTDHQTELGADLVANAVAASALLPRPFAVCDFGAVTTVSAVNRKGEFCGVLILPGLTGGLECMSYVAAALPRIALKPPQHLLGRNTEEAMRSGMLYGMACAVDGLLQRLEEETGGEPLSAVACGEEASLVLPYCRREIQEVPTLTLDGLYALYRRNVSGNGAMTGDHEKNVSRATGFPEA